MLLLLEAVVAVAVLIDAERNMTFRLLASSSSSSSLEDAAGNQ